MLLSCARVISDFRFLDFVSITNIKLPEIEFHIVSLSNIFKYIVSSSDRLFSRKKNTICTEGIT